MIRWGCMGCAVLLTIGVSVTAWAQDVTDDQSRKEVREVVKRLQSRYEKTRDLQADFVQKTTIEGFERPMTSSGKVYIKKPAACDGTIWSLRPRTSMWIGMM